MPVSAGAPGRNSRLHLDPAFGGRAQGSPLGWTGQAACTTRIRVGVGVGNGDLSSAFW